LHWNGGQYGAEKSQSQFVHQIYRAGTPSRAQAWIKRKRALQVLKVKKNSNLLSGSMPTAIGWIFTNRGFLFKRTQNMLRFQNGDALPSLTYRPVEAWHAMLLLSV
jgi:hypothetical protein